MHWNRTRIGNVDRRLVTGVLLALLSLQGRAETETDEAKKYAVSPETYKVLNQSRELSDQSRFSQALSLLQAQVPKVAGNRYERALIHQHLAYIHLERHDYLQAVIALEETLRAADTLPPDTVHNLRYNLAQAAVQAERFEQAIKQLDLWFANEPRPSAEAWYLRALTHYKIKRFDRSADYLKKALALSERQDWQILLLSIVLEQKKYREAVPLLNKLIAQAPNEQSWWLNLTDVHLMLKDYGKALSVLELAHRKFNLPKDQVVRLAQLYMHKNAPYLAAKLLTREMERGRIERNTANLELLANGWAMAREHDKEFTILKQLAAMRNDGNLYLRCAHILLSREKWNESAGMLNKALATDNLKNRQQAQLMLGIVYYNSGRMDYAESAFTRACKHHQTKDQAQRWLQQIKSQQKVDS